MNPGRIVLGSLLVLAVVSRAQASHPVLTQDPFIPPSSAVTFSAEAATTGVVGTRAVALILFHYADQLNGVTVPMAQTLAQTLPAFYRAASYGTLQLTADVFGPYTVTQPSGVCLGFGPAQAETLMRAHGVPLDHYVHRIFFAPRSPDCPWNALAIMGELPNRAYMNGTNDLRINLHELGHLLGMHHSHSLKCPTGQSLCTPGTRIEYGDQWDLMGSAGAARHPNAAQKIQMGWLAPIEAGPGVYTLTGLEQSPSALRIRRRGIDEDLLVEYRAAPLRKVLVHLQRYIQPGPFLLQMFPNSYRLIVGKTWIDPQTGQTLLLEAQTDTTARVRVGP